MTLYVKNNLVHGKCDSCPFNGEVDNKHRLASYIVKSPPVTKSQAIKVGKVIEEKHDEKKEKTDKK